MIHGKILLGNQMTPSTIIIKKNKFFTNNCPHLFTKDLQAKGSFSFKWNLVSSFSRFLKASFWESYGFSIIWDCPYTLRGIRFYVNKLDVYTSEICEIDTYTNFTLNAFNGQKFKVHLHLNQEKVALRNVVRLSLKERQTK